MGNGEWGMGNGEWGMGNGEWGMGNGEWGMGNGEWGMGNGEWRMANGEWRMANGEWRMANGEWRMANGEWKVPCLKTAFDSPLAIRYSLLLERKASQPRQLGTAEAGQGRALAAEPRRQRRQVPGREARRQAAAHLLLQRLDLLRRRLGHAATEPEHVAERRTEAALAAAAHGLHHVGHLAVHLEEPVDVLDPGAGARRDALLAARLEDVG